VHPEAAHVEKVRLDAWRQSGWQVWPWTVNGPAEWWRLVEVGADALITDDPGGLVDFLAREKLR